METVKKACGSFGLGSQRSAIRFIFRHVRHYAKPASPGQWWRHGHHHVVGRDRERYDLVDDRRDMATGTPRAVRGRLVAGLEYGGGDQHQCPVRHLPLGLGLLELAGLQRRHRAHRVLRLLLDPRHGAALACRSVRFLRPWNEVPALFGSAHPPRPPRPARAWSRSSWDSVERVPATSARHREVTGGRSAASHVRVRPARRTSALGMRK